MHPKMVLLALVAMLLILPLESSATLGSCYTPKTISSDLFSSKIAVFNMSADNIPEYVNWIERGAVTYVKRQASCGSCWAFATVATLESAWQIKTGNLISLSAQFLIDCNTENLGCINGGSLDEAYVFATELYGAGIPSEVDYPYKAYQQECRNDVTPAAGFRGFRRTTPGDEQQLLQAVVQQPVAVGIATPNIIVTREFADFKGGKIYTGPCGVELNHAVVIVGYGQSDDGTKYWLIKNSWGESWGESGYFRLIRGTGIPGGHCGVHSDPAFYPIVPDT